MSLTFSGYFSNGASSSSISTQLFTLWNLLAFALRLFEPPRFFSIKRSEFGFIFLIDLFLIYWFNCNNNSILKLNQILIELI